ncbi:Actin-related 4 isoform B [Micractinium conductrix]|uniref:Actin-related 4 isoform B n=1 Tax=Micractinium conductrix TaxID=554055 RepID=A0A2P6VR00_9CHLO|nr:Actin-related 4 isoform B [Micractinium conductrix]|eukprot:PSC76501.1 Actin-related 4 isoform B [Micractinium conductrix]
MLVLVLAAVHDGFLLQKSVLTSPLAGQLLAQCMAAALEARGNAVRPRYEFTRKEGPGGKLEVVPVDAPSTASYRRWCVEAIAGDVKDAICRVSDNAFDPEENANIPTVTYELPDGQEIAVGADRFGIPEVLFNPGLLPRYPPAVEALKARQATPEGLQGIPHLTNDCISKCDVDIRKDLYGGIVLTGGTAGFVALRDRLEKEVAELAPQMAKVKVVSPANAVERRYSVWIGGSILASLGTFQQMWMSKAEYREYGAGLIHKKAP